MDITNATLGAMKPTPSMFASGPGHGIQLRSGRLIVPGNVHVKDMNGIREYGYGSSHSTVLYSDDGGETWRPSGMVPLGRDAHNETIETKESQAVELEDNIVCLNSRTANVRQPRAISCSVDGGMTFKPPTLHQKLVEPGAHLKKGHIVPKLYGGRQGSMQAFPAPLGSEVTEKSHKTWVLFSNPANATLRKNLSIRLSIDGLKTWSSPWTIHAGSSAYSDLTYFEAYDGTNVFQSFAILYEKGVNIAFKSFTLDSVLNNTAESQLEVT